MFALFFYELNKLKWTPESIPNTRSYDRIWWLCLVPISTTMFASDLGVQNGQRFNSIIQENTFYEQ